MPSSGKEAMAIVQERAPVLSVVIPAFNEEAAIAETVESVRAVLTATGEEGFEIIVVDDGSDDRTGEIAAVHGATVIRKLQNLGYGNSLKIGILAAANDTIIITDADGTYPVDQIPALLATYREGWDMVVGARTGPHYHESPIKSPLRQLLKWLVEFTTGRKIPDVNSGLRVFSRREALPFFGHLSEGFSFTTSITLGYMLRMKTVTYLPMPYHPRVGRTKVRMVRDSLRTIQFIVQAILYYNPMKIFLVLAMASALIGGLTVLAGLAFHAITGILLGVGGMLVAVVIFALGLLGEQLRQISLRE